MKKIRLLLYCTKSKKYLVRNDLPNEKLVFQRHYQLLNEMGVYHLIADREKEILNGKIVAECDFEVEEIFYSDETDIFWTKTLLEEELCKRSCLKQEDLSEYLNLIDSYSGNSGYAIHIKNLNIFDKPKELSDYYIIQSEHANPIDIEEDIKTVKKAPQNMMYCWDFWQDHSVIGNRYFTKKILISIRPEWLVKILNGEKTIEVRKQVLKEMLGNETR